ncbi:murein hydrolase activator EnvC family protein [Actinotalea fermentans]|uniref:M23ase beta-sheet core domain-containing protein n=1 Tax=Actinotalea fermentans TaxID=43671 RepID=A0A511YW29_9CELL|nr:M23 family metallopeptidase [Actinotalea fermentans]KGM16329.1 hypothetical protein N867_01515 [Actinotalea fermentans ATCC 43279 = JCM 9966 = DSM 3133]GEN79336.1 hypothetical protein AFE02nite_10700 [Actinotalea fermentans]
MHPPSVVRRPPRPARGRTSRVLVIGLLATAFLGPLGAPGPSAGAALADAASAGAVSAARVPIEPVTGDVVLPVDGPVVRFFVRPAERWSAGHRGVDLRAEPGAVVRSPVDGVVEFAGPVAGRTVLTVVRADGLRTSLEPLSEVAEVGTPVAAGDAVGVLAVTGGPGDAGGHCGGTPCLHWGVRRDGEYVDPLDLLARATVVLLPWP